jgi:hypothetical protein
VRAGAPAENGRREKLRNRRIIWYSDRGYLFTRENQGYVHAKREKEKKKKKKKRTGEYQNNLNVIYSRSRAAKRVDQPISFLYFSFDFLIFLFLFFFIFLNLYIPYWRAFSFYVSSSSSIRSGC